MGIEFSPPEEPLVCQLPASTLKLPVIDKPVESIVNPLCGEVDPTLIGEKLKLMLERDRNNTEELLRALEAIY